MRLKSVRIYADDARIIAIGADGNQELPRSTRVFLRGISDDGGSVVAISLERDGRFAEGTGNGPRGPFVLRAEPHATGPITLTATSLQSTLPPGFKFDFKCGDESLALTSAGHGQRRRSTARGRQREKPAALARRRRRCVTRRLRSTPIRCSMSRMFGNNTTAPRTTSPACSIR